MELLVWYRLVLRFPAIKPNSLPVHSEAADFQAYGNELLVKLRGVLVIAGHKKKKEACADTS